MIDHLIYAAPNLDEATDDLADRFGVEAAGGGQHLGVGTRNRLLALGPRTYLELIAPDPNQPEPPTPRPYGVGGGTGLVGWAITCDDIEQARADAIRDGFDPGHIIDGHRRTATGETIHWRLTSNALTAGVVPFLIDWGTTPHPARTAPRGLTLDSLHLEHPTPALITSRLRALNADVDVRPGERPALVARINGQTLR